MYVGYSALEDFFPSWEIKPNEQCEDKHCVLRQKEFRANPVSRKRDFLTKPESTDAPVHEESFGIEMVEETAPADLADDTLVTTGLRMEYAHEGRKDTTDHASGDDVEDAGESLDVLMAKMKNL